MKRYLTVIIAGALSLCVSAEETDTTLNAYAAGYKANFTCSATFNGGKSPSQIKEDELTGIYSLIADKVNGLTAEINSNDKWVRVAYDDGKRIRYSVWRPRLGCVDLPVGATEQDIKQVYQPFQNNPAEQADTGDPWQSRNAVNEPTGNDKLDAVIEQAFTKHYGEGARTSAVLIATPNKIIAERYKEDFTPETAQRTWSVAKSIGASVIGAAVQQEILSVDQKAGLQNWSHPLDPRQRITLENLLHMASGLDSNQAGNRTDRVYMGGGLVSDTATETALEVEPGSRWKYANNDTMLALRVLRETMSSEEAYVTFPYEALLDKRSFGPLQVPPERPRPPRNSPRSRRISRRPASRYRDEACPV